MTGLGQRSSCFGKDRRLKFSLLTRNSFPPTRNFSKKPVEYPKPARRKTISRPPSKSSGRTTSAIKRKNHLRRGDNGIAGSLGAFLFSDLRPAFNLFGRRFMVGSQKSRSRGLQSRA